MRYERFWIYTIFLLAMACSRETPAPPATPAQTQPTATTAAPPAPSATTAAPSGGGSYAEAIVWLQTAPKFHFVLDEGGVHAEGDLTRKTVGAESLQLRVNGEEWRAGAGPKGVTWEQRKGRAWTAAAAPAFGNQIYQRITLAFDPQKKEGSAQFVATEDGANHYRFTNANTGEIHHVWVSNTDNHVSRMTIGDSFELKIEI
jgi:hypothetical protein